MCSGCWKMFKKRRVNTIENIVARLQQTETGCLIWPGKYRVKGYAMVGYGGKLRRLHKLLYEHLIGPIPDGLVLDHLCRTRDCGNVQHLEVVTIKENAHRGIECTKERCRHGHLRTPENTIVVKRTGWKQCRTCKNDQQRIRQRIAAATQRQAHEARP